MAIEGKLTKLSDLTTVAKDYNGKIDKKVDKVEGKELIDTTAITKLEGIEEGAQKNTITKIQVNGTDQTNLDGTVNLDIDAVISGDGFVSDDELGTQLAEYLKSAEAETTYVKDTELESKVKAVVGTVYTYKGTKADLTEIKAVESPTAGDVYNAEDTGANYAYVGPDEGDEGWDKLSDTIDLSAYATTENMNTELAKKANATDVDGLLSEADLQFASEEEITAALKAGETPAA